VCTWVVEVDAGFVGRVDEERVDVNGAGEGSVAFVVDVVVEVGGAIGCPDELGFLQEGERGWCPVGGDLSVFDGLGERHGVVFDGGEVGGWEGVVVEVVGW